MNILYISTVFPNETESSTIYTDLAEELVKRGHNVTAVAAEEKKKKLKTRIVSQRGCTVLRVRCGNMYDVPKLNKGLSILTLSYYMKKAMRKYLREQNFDLILFEAPPVTLSGVVKKAKNLFRASAFLMMKDIFPQNAVDLGMMKKNGIIYKYFKYKEKQLYKIADNIGCMSEGNRQYIHKYSNIDLDKLSIFPNTKRIKSFELINKNNLIREKYGIPMNSVVFVFGGNMGKPQGMTFLTEAIVKSSCVNNAFFVLVGRGTEKDYVEKKLKNSKNVLICENLPRDEYEQLILSCDVGIVSLDSRFTIPNYPSRILSYMEYGMPVLAATDLNTDFKNLIELSECGYWCPSDDVDAFVNHVRKLTENKPLRDSMGKNGRKYIENNFNVGISVDLIEDYYQESHKSVK